MGKLAIDVVLLPPEHIMDLAKSINAELIKKDDAINFIDKSSIPHITLCMSGIKKEDLPKLSKILGKIASEFHPVNFLIKHLEDDYTTSDGKVFACLATDKPKDLQKLHEEILRRCKALFVEIDHSNMHVSANTRQLSAKSINAFAREDCGENYYPHLSLGLGKLASKDIELPETFTAKRLAICHLGNWCTCRKILFETELKKAN